VFKNSYKFLKILYPYLFKRRNLIKDIMVTMHNRADFTYLLDFNYLHIYCIAKDTLLSDLQKVLAVAHCLLKNY